MSEQKRIIALSTGLRDELKAVMDPVFKDMNTIVAAQEEVFLPLLQIKYEYGEGKLSHEEMTSRVEALAPVIAKYENMPAPQHTMPSFNNLIAKYGETLAPAMMTDTAFGEYLDANYKKYCDKLGENVDKIGEITGEPNHGLVGKKTAQECFDAMHSILKR